MQTEWISQQFGYLELMDRIKKGASPEELYAALWGSNYGNPTEQFCENLLSKTWYWFDLLG
jgi:hypothetical protein